MNKAVIIINGNGGVGKDTLCAYAGQYYKARNISAITPFKEIAKMCGWKGEKDGKARKFLADLKQICIEYNDYPTKYLLEEYERFLDSDSTLLFVHIREGNEIDKLKKHIKIPCLTLLIRRKADIHKNWGNESDDNVNNYDYDYYYDNDKLLEEAKIDFIKFLKTILKQMGVKIK